LAAKISLYRIKNSHGNIYDEANAVATRGQARTRMVVLTCFLFYCFLSFCFWISLNCLCCYQKTVQS